MLYNAIYIIYFLTHWVLNLTKKVSSVQHTKFVVKFSKLQVAYIIKKYISPRKINILYLHMVVCQHKKWTYVDKLNEFVWTNNYQLIAIQKM